MKSSGSARTYAGTVSGRFRWVLLCSAFALLGVGCSGKQVAPVVERSGKPTRPVAPAAEVASRTTGQPDGATYVVKPGDTLYSIALNLGQDYRELAAANGINDPGRIRVGQTIRVPGSGASAGTAASTATQGGDGVITKPIVLGGVPETRQPGESGESSSKPPTSVPSASEGGVVPPVQPSLKQTLPETPPAPPAQAVEEAVDWAWPAQGKVLASFNEATNKGLDIAGRIGDPVVAASGGRVVYTGTNLRGYGKLVVIKHSNAFLSAYAHNSAILVKEGQNVSKGQKIAELGDTDSSSPKLHFEIRQQGKPTDPAKLLPAR